MKTKKGIFIAILSALSMGAFAQLDSTGRPDTARSRFALPNRPATPAPNTPPSPYPSTLVPTQPPTKLPSPNTPGTSPTTMPPQTAPSSPPPPHGLTSEGISAAKLKQFNHI